MVRSGWIVTATHIKYSKNVQIWQVCCVLKNMFIFCPFGGAFLLEPWHSILSEVILILNGCSAHVHLLCRSNAVSKSSLQDFGQIYKKSLVCKNPKTFCLLVPKYQSTHKKSVQSGCYEPYTDVQGVQELNSHPFLRSETQWHVLIRPLPLEL